MREALTFGDAAGVRKRRQLWGQEEPGSCGFPQRFGGAYRQLQPNTRLQARVCRLGARHSLLRRIAAPGPSTFDRTLHPVNVTVPDEHGSFSLRAYAVSSVSGVSAIIMEASLSCRIDRVESLLGAGTVSARADLSIQHRSERSTRGINR